MFPYIASVPWPIPQPQIDWVDQVSNMEGWLEQTFGPKDTRWIWAKEQSHNVTQACIAFNMASDRTLFLLKWTC